MTLSEIIALFTGAEKVLSAEGTQAMFTQGADVVKRHLAAEGFSIDKLRENETTIPDPVRRTDQPDQ